MLVWALCSSPFSLQLFQIEADFSSPCPICRPLCFLLWNWVKRKKKIKQTQIKLYFLLKHYLSAHAHNASCSQAKTITFFLSSFKTYDLLVSISTWNIWLSPSGVHIYIFLWILFMYVCNISIIANTYFVLVCMNEWVSLGFE